MKLNKIIALLREGADADIWYDAKMYQDKPAMKRIAKVQRAMKAAACIVERDCLDTDASRHGAMPIPLVGPKEPRPGKSEVVRMDDEGEGSSPEVLRAVNNLLQRPLTAAEAAFVARHERLHKIFALTKPEPEPEGGPYASPIEEAMTEYWGARCPDFAEGCSCCDAWAAYDKAMAAQQRIDASLMHMAQPHYGDTDTKLDHYAEGVNLLKGRGLYD